MARDDSINDATSVGKPPFRSHPLLEAALTKKRVPSITIHPAILILVWSLQIAAVVVAAWASLNVFLAYMFRFDGTLELKMVKQVDVEVGGLLALAIVLFFIPVRIKKPLLCILILGVAAFVWFFVSWNLLAHHEWVNRVRSGF